MRNVARLILVTVRKGIIVLENPSIPFVNIVASFFAAITLRNFLELFEGRIHASEVFRFIHFDLSYIALALALILLLHVLTKETISMVARVVFPLFIVLSIAPILDIIMSGGSGYEIEYLNPFFHNNLSERFLTFFGKMHPIYGGITPGMRMEIALVLVVSWFYLYLKTHRWFFSILGTFLIYVLIFAYTSLPFPLVSLSTWLGIPMGDIQKMLINTYLILIALLGVVVLYRSHPHEFRTLLRDVRPYRLLHYLSMFGLGFVIVNINGNGIATLTLTSILSAINVAIAIGFAWIFSVMSNNIIDRPIDEISNPERPLVHSDISLPTYQSLHWFILIGSLLYALGAGTAMFFFLLLYIGNYYLYSNPPFRFKRITLFSKFFIALNSLILIFAGYQHLNGSLNGFPILLTWYILLGLTTVINFIDIKDEKGDRAAGIKTLPVVLGLQRAKILIGLFFIAMYASIVFLIQDLGLFILAIITGWIQFYLVNKTTYDERWVFRVYLGSLIGVFCYYLLFLKT